VKERALIKSCRYGIGNGARDENYRELIVQGKDLLLEEAASPTSLDSIHTER
jgi:hypothetical protein